MDLIYKGEQVILPHELVEEAIDISHDGSHPGQSMIKRRMRTHFWFPAMDQIIEERISSCPLCQIHTTSPVKSHLVPTPIPDQPWDSVSLDLFGPLEDQRHILVARCHLSRFPDAKIVPSTSSKQVIPALAQIYDNYGNPKIHKADK